MPGLEDDGQVLEIVKGEQPLGDGSGMVIPQTWWFRTAPVDENAVCIRVQVLAEIMMVGGLL